MFTRTINTYHASAYSLELVGGQPTAKLIGEAEYQATTPSAAAARRALKQAGVDVPRGAQIVSEVTDSATFACSIDEFLSIAHRVD